MSLFTKALLAIGLVALCVIQIPAQTVTILKSQSSHPLQDMDTRWEAECNGMGYSAQLETYSFLDNSCLIDLTDILIIASAIIDIQPNQIENIKTFVESGGSLYIQGEYDSIFPGNQLFISIAEHFGDSFSYGAIGTENIGPLGVGSIINNQPNNIDSLGYFWYGISGTGVGPFTPILSKGSDHYGFIYEPMGDFNGKVVTMTDQDWIRLDFAPALFENLVSSLAIPAPSFPEVLISTTDQNFCLGTNVNFKSSIVSNSQNTPNLDYQWMVNGMDLPGETADELTISTLSEGDVVECRSALNYGCNTNSHVSNPILMAPIFPINTANVDMGISQLSFCGNDANEFEVSINNPDGINISTIEWSWNNVVLNNSMTQNLMINDLQDGDNISVRFSVMDPCFGLTWVQADNITVDIIQPLVTNVTIDNPVLEFCVGDIIEYNLTGDNWGTSPTIEWIVNGLTSANTSTTFDASELQEGLYTIQANVQSSELCVTQEIVQTTPMAIQISPIQELNATLTTDRTTYCKFEMASFTIDPVHLGDNAEINWMIDGNMVSNQGLTYETNTLTDGQIISVSITNNDACYIANSIDLDPIAITIADIETPYIIIDADNSKVCPGTEIALQASGDFWGNSTQIKWFVNGEAQNNQTDILNYTIEETTTSFTAEVVSDLACVTNANASSENLMIEVAPIDVEVIEVNAEHCDQQDGMIQLQADGGFGLVNGTFDNGDTGFALTGLDAGTLNFIATDSLGCSVEKTVIIPAEFGPQIDDLQVAQPNCTSQTFGASTVQLANAEDYSIFWLDANDVEVAEGQMVNSLTSGTYTVAVMDDFGCIVEETFEINDTEPVFTAGNQELDLALGDEYLLDPNVLPTTQNLTYSWTGGTDLECEDCETNTVSPMESTRYTVTITNESGCSTTTEFLVRVRKNYEVYLPNAFSPNNDGRNDFYTIGVGDEVETVNSLKIFDRWGACVYRAEDLAKDQSEGWDGFFKGKRATAGVYVVMVEVTFRDGDVQMFSGDVAIMK